MSKLYFSKVLFEMNFPQPTKDYEAWTNQCDGKRVKHSKTAPLGLVCRVDGVEFYVAEEWCNKHYPRRRKIARSKHKNIYK